LAFQPDLIVRSQRVVTPNGIRPAAVHIRGEKIVGVLEFSDVLAGCPLDDAGQAAVIPGVVDTHVHVNDSDSLRGERLEMTTRAAAAGGITALMEMRLNSMVTPTGPSPSSQLQLRASRPYGTPWTATAMSTSAYGAAPCLATSSCRCSMQVSSASRVVSSHQAV
jgi:allantoinase